MMDIEWEKEWNNSLEAIRMTHNIPTYRSVFPADLLESVESASVWKKLQLGYQLVRYNLRLKNNNHLPSLQAQ